MWKYEETRFLSLSDMIQNLYSKFFLLFTLINKYVFLKYVIYWKILNLIDSTSYSPYFDVSRPPISSPCRSLLPCNPYL